MLFFTAFNFCCKIADRRSCVKVNESLYVKVSPVHWRLMVRWRSPGRTNVEVFPEHPVFSSFLFDMPSWSGWPCGWIVGFCWHVNYLHRYQSSFVTYSDDSYCWFSISIRYVFFQCCRNQNITFLLCLWDIDKKR